MNDYVLLTDSSADLTDALVKELGVEVLPLSFTMRNKTYRNWPDNREIDPKDFYRQLREGEMATTSAVNVSDFTETIEPHLKEGRDVLVVAFSSGLSATCHSAQIAAQELSEQYPERKVYVVDSLCASLGQGLLVWYAARMKNEGRGIGAVRDWLEENKLHLCHWFTVDDLHFLKRGGRISSATAVLGTMLSIKPVMHVDDEGHLTKVGTARGRNASLKALVDHMVDRHRPRGPDRLHQPRRLRGGRQQGGRGREAPLRRADRGAQQRGPRHRRPLRPGHRGPVLPGEAPLMEDVKWLEVTLDTTEAELDALCARLTGNGVTGLAIEDEEDFKTFLEQNRQYWDYVDDGLLARMKGVCRVKFYITDDADGRKQLEGWLAGIDQPYSLASLGDNDWAHSWQKYYKPMPVGERLYIVPEWERGEPVPAGKAPLYLNPGLTFGTGSHASTQLCLMGLERYTVPGKPVLDLGCGSGILSIAALVLGASAAAAVDIDPKAVDVAYENAALNGIGRDRYNVRAGNVLTDGALVAELARRKYALVLANIVADVIIPLSAKAGEFLDADGVFLCSGIIDTRAGEVEAALERNGLAVFERREQNGWVALAARAAR